MTARVSPAESRRFLQDAPRPPLRTRRSPKPGAAKPPDSVVWLVEDVDHGRVLVRGKNLRPILELAGVYDRAAWSVSAKGYVIDSRDIPDVSAACDYSSAPWRWRTLRTASES